MVKLLHRKRDDRRMFVFEGIHDFLHVVRIYGYFSLDVWRTREVAKLPGSQTINFTHTLAFYSTLWIFIALNRGDRVIARFL